MTNEEIRDLNEAGVGAWQCPDCGAMVHDIVDTCPVCLPDPIELIEGVYADTGFRSGCFAGGKRGDLMHCDLVKRVIAIKLFQALELGKDYETEDEIEEAVDNIQYSFGFGDDAFDIAKCLDDHGITMTAEKVEIIDNFDAYEILKQATKQWVIDNKITVDFKVGDAVEFKVMGRNTPYNGTVTRVMPDEAKVFVYSPELGHVKEGVGTHATILPCEEVALLKTPIQTIA